MSKICSFRYYSKGFAAVVQLFGREPPLILEETYMSICFCFFTWYPCCIFYICIYKSNCDPRELKHFSFICSKFKFLNITNLQLKGSLQEKHRSNCWKTATSRPNTPNSKLSASITKKFEAFRYMKILKISRNKLVILFLGDAISIMSNGKL